MLRWQVLNNFVRMNTIEFIKLISYINSAYFSYFIMTFVFKIVLHERFDSLSSNITVRVIRLML